MSRPQVRRGFLRGLVGLPLLGGGLTLIGAPTAVAEPISEHLLRVYASWLWGERGRALDELYPAHAPGFRNGLDMNEGVFFHHDVPDYSTPPPSARAAVILAAAGCEWRRPAR